MSKIKTLTLWACIALTPIMFSCTARPRNYDDNMLKQAQEYSDIAEENAIETLAEIEEKKVSCNLDAYQKIQSCLVNGPLGLETLHCSITPAEGCTEPKSSQ